MEINHGVDIMIQRSKHTILTRSTYSRRKSSAFKVQKLFCIRAHEPVTPHTCSDNINKNSMELKAWVRRTKASIMTQSSMANILDTARRETILKMKHTTTITNMAISSRISLLVISFASCIVLESGIAEVVDITGMMRLVDDKQYYNDTIFQY